MLAFHWTTLENKMKIYLADGYNGHKLRFYAQPVSQDVGAVCVRCAEHGMAYMLKWCSRKDWQNAILDALSAEAQALGLYE